MIIAAQWIEALIKVDGHIDQLEWNHLTDQSPIFLFFYVVQTVGIAVFTGLSFSFYVFFIPFVGSRVLKFHIYAAFSPVVSSTVPHVILEHEMYVFE